MAYLDDHPPERRQFYCPRRNGIQASGTVVVHTAENTPDFVAFDGGAEAVAHWIEIRDTPGSYHDLADSDSWIPMVRYKCEAFHDATGTHINCGAAFVAPTTGRVIIYYDARVANDTTGQGTLVAPAVRTGGTVGSGTTIVAAADDDAIQITTASTTNLIRAGCHRFVSGLTPGDTYNVRLEHRVGGGIGTLIRRRVTVCPAT